MLRRSFELSGDEQRAGFRFVYEGGLRVATAGHSFHVWMPGLLAEMAFVLALLTWGGRVLGAQAATWTALAFWLNPVVWIGGAVLGARDYV